jgi:hypothetical protein
VQFWRIASRAPQVRWRRVWRENSQPVTRACNACTTFFGQALSVEDFLDEQNYFRSRLRRLNRMVHGVGVITGLGVSIVGKGNSARVVIEPGLAIDAQGEEIEAPEAISLPLPGQGKTLVLQIRFAERPCQPVPAATSDDSAGAQQYSRIMETCEALLSAAADASAVTLARLRHTNGRWWSSGVR